MLLYSFTGIGQAIVRIMAWPHRLLLNAKSEWNERNCTYVIVCLVAQRNLGGEYFWSVFTHDGGVHSIPRNNSSDHDIRFFFFAKDKKMGAWLEWKEIKMRWIWSIDAQFEAKFKG